MHILIKDGYFIALMYPYKHTDVIMRLFATQQINQKKYAMFGKGFFESLSGTCYWNNGEVKWR